MSPSKHWLSPSNPAPSVELRPERALLTPAWIGSLLALGANDHLLKGAGVLPDALTGKLSDVAGMMVAPALLAALTRTTSRRGLFLCHLAVGAVFAAINLSHEAAGLWSALMGAVAVPWKITVDPTDLLALPALALSWRALTPAMSRPLPARPLRALEGALAGTGLALSIATSPAPPADDFFQPIFADAFVFNNTDHDVIVRVRELDRESVQFDCEELAADPDGTLTEAVFGEVSTWTISPGGVASARGDSWGDLDTSSECYAVLVEGDAMPSTLLFWESGDLTAQWIERAPTDDEKVRGSIVLTDDDDQLAVEVNPPSLVHALAVVDDPVDGACVEQPDGERLAWSRAPATTVRIAGIDVGPDGCIAVQFGTMTDAKTDWYVCMEPSLFPFEVGEWVIPYDGGDFIHLKRVADPQDPVAVPQAELKLFAGSETPAPFDVVVSLRPDTSCALAPDACGTVSRAASLSATRIGQDGTLPIAVGQTVTLPGAGTTVDLRLVHAQERVVVASSCSEGPPTLGGDIELIATLRETP
ncbi:MAG: hypothetical protein R3B09_33745 [Nannocystaceae bacterium]